MIKLNQFTRFLIGFLAVILLVWILWQIRTIAIYFAVSVVFALMGRPLMRLYSRIKIKEYTLPKWALALMTLLSFIAVVSFLIRIFLPVIASQIEIIAALDVEKLITAFEGPITKLEAWLKNMNIEEINKETIQNELSKYLDFSIIGDLFGTVLAGISGVFVGLFSICFITFFLLKDKSIVNNIVDSLTPDKYLDKVRSILSDTKDLLSRYFLGIALQVTIITTIVSVGLTIVGIPNALLIGLITGLINIIPYLGPLIGASIGIILGILSNVHMGAEGVDLLPLLGKIVLVFATAQMTDNFVLQPVIFSKSVHAHPLEIFLVIMIAGTLAGIVGMILAVPSYTFLRIVGREFFQGYKVVQGLTKDL